MTHVLVRKGGSLSTLCEKVGVYIRNDMRHPLVSQSQGVRQQEFSNKSTEEAKEVTHQRRQIL